MFTRLLVLCRWRTRPSLPTPLPSHTANVTGHAAEQHCGRKRKAEAASMLMDNPMSILVECQQNDGGAKSRVVVDNASPRWLHHFARFFLTRRWNEIYTTPKYAATERFQDIIAEVVRAHLQRAGGSSCDLAALVNRRNILRGRSLMLGDFVYRL